MSLATLVRCFQAAHPGYDAALYRILDIPAGYAEIAQFTLKDAKTIRALPPREIGAKSSASSKSS